MCDQTINNIVSEILKKIPKPNYGEIPELYQKLDEMSKTVVNILIKHDLLDKENTLVRFDKTNENLIFRLISENPDVMIPFFIMICGFSDRELERLYGIKNVYSLKSKKQLMKLAEILKEYLKYPYLLETIIYKFYKNWEEHQKRHFRGRKTEDLVAEVLREHGYTAGKIKIVYEGRELEIDCAIPPDSQLLRVAIMVRYGVFKDLIKRVKEYSSEFDDLLKLYPEIKFVVVYLVPHHEMNRIDEIRRKIENVRKGKRPYDLVILTMNELRELLPRKLEEWGIPKYFSS